METGLENLKKEGLKSAEQHVDHRGVALLRRPVERQVARVVGHVRRARVEQPARDARAQAAQAARDDGHARGGRNGHNVPG